MKYEYEKIYKNVRYMQEEYSFGETMTFDLLSLLNKIGAEGWELVGSVSGNIIVKRIVVEED